MKTTAILLLLLPFFCNAQTEKEEKNKPNDGILHFVHADKTLSVPAPKKEDGKERKNDTKYSGNVEFKIGNNLIDCDSATVHESEQTVDAYHVTLSNPEYFTAVGGTLKYNKEDQHGVLQTDIKVTALNGALIGTSEMVDVDLSHETYRIGKGNLVPASQK